MKGMNVMAASPKTRTLQGADYGLGTLKVKAVDELPSTTRNGAGRKRQFNPVEEDLLRSWNEETPIQYSGVEDVKKLKSYLYNAANRNGMGIDIRVLADDVVVFQARERREKVKKES